MSLDSRDVGLGSWISNPAVSSKENMHGHSPEDGDLIQAPTEVFSGQQDSSAKVLVVSGTGGLTHAGWFSRLKAVPLNRDQKPSN